MAVLCSEIWLLIGVVFVLQLPVIRSQLCREGWKFHDLTGSCMTIKDFSQTYVNAKSNCETDSSSSTTRGKGHLVFIFDQATDEFVKGLLNEDNLDRALIGLNDRSRNGDYAWGDSRSIPANYTGWADNPHKSDTSKHAVVMTKYGWKEFDGNSPAYFVCQVNVDFPTPRMVCPVAEVGQESSDITCTIDKRPSFTMTSLRFMQTAAVVASCDGRSCWSSPGYQHDVDVRKSQETHSSVSWSLKLTYVRISDETDWTCSVRFNNGGSWVASQPCSLKVYTTPTDIQCSHMFVQRMVRTTCTTAKVYPQVGCTWQVKYGPRELDVYNLASSNEEVSAEGYYRATCNASFSINNAGTYVIAVVMKPNWGTGTVKEISVSVAPPRQPPQLYLAGQRLESVWVDVVENQTLIITCHVPGGDPEVYRTIIKCNNIPQPFEFESDGSSVTMDVRVVRAFHGKTCTCSALHAASYRQTSSVEIRVTYPATVDSFRIYSYISTVINRGDEITFDCRASGNPTSKLIVQQQSGPMLTNSSTGYTTFKKTATCSDMGIYVCLASNMVKGQHHENRKVAHLQVRCAPELCSGMSSPRFPAAVGAPSVSIKICVQAYPAPTSISLYKGNTTDHRLTADKFRAYFNFTNEEDGLGDITVMIFHFAEEDIGDYLLYSEYRAVGTGVLYSHLTFSLFAQGPPRCPTNFTIVQADPHSVKLSWIGGFNGGLNQTFTVSRVDSPSATASPRLTKLGTVEDQDDNNVYAVTGLSESTTYTFALEVTNGKGSGNCSHVQVNVSTSASAAFIGGRVVTLVVVPVIIVLLLVILVVAVVVVRRRRRHGPKKSADYITDTARTEDKATSREAANESDGDNVYANTTTRVTNAENKTKVKPARKKSEEAEESNTYAQVSKQNTTENKKKVKPARKKSEEAEESNTYAQVSKQNKTAKQARGRPDGKSSSEQGQESLYSRFTRNINLKGHKKGNSEQTYNELPNVYQNDSNAGVAQSSADPDPDNVYANVKASSSKKQGNTKETKKNNDRTVNDDGLVYVTVAINKRTTNPEIVSATKPPAKVSKTEPEPETVEYLALNFSPGAKQQ